VAKGVQSHSWRRPIGSLNYLLSSHVWRQDHCGFTQDRIIHDCVWQEGGGDRVYLPPDANCLLSVTTIVFAAEYINVVVAGSSLRLSGDDERNGQALRSGLVFGSGPVMIAAATGRSDGLLW
jgi:phosphoketolase